MYDPTTLQSGDVLLMIGRPQLDLGGALDAGIEWATDSPFDHAALVGDGVLLEQLWTVTQSPLDKYAANGWRFQVRGVASYDADKAIAFVTARLGQTYGVKDILADAARDILHLPLWPANSPRAKQRYTCSALVTAAWASAGVMLTYAPWPSPADLSFSALLVGPRPWGAGAA